MEINLETFWTELELSFYLHLCIVLDYKYPQSSKAALPPKILDQLRPFRAIALKLTLFSSLNYFYLFTFVQFIMISYKILQLIAFISSITSTFTAIFSHFNRINNYFQIFLKFLEAFDLCNELNSTMFCMILQHQTENTLNVSYSLRGCNAPLVELIKFH